MENWACGKIIQKTEAVTKLTEKINRKSKCTEDIRAGQQGKDLKCVCDPSGQSRKGGTSGEERKAEYSPLKSCMSKLLQPGHDTFLLAKGTLQMWSFQGS